MLIQRCQIRTVEDVYDFNITDGQHGRGIYFFKAGDTAMQKYYAKQSKMTWTAEIDDNLVKDLSHKNWEYWELKEFIYKNPQYKAFILRHQGHDIPTSKEILVTDAEALQLK